MYEIIQHPDFIGYVITAVLTFVIWFFFLRKKPKPRNPALDNLIDHIHEATGQIEDMKIDKRILNKTNERLH